MAKSVLSVLLGVLLLEAVSALPEGFTTYFSSTSCPSGWRELNEVRGRLVVSVSDPTTAGVTVNQPLTDQENVAHSHYYETVVNVPHKGVAAAQCCDHQGAQTGQYPIFDDSEPAPSGYPFTQLILCTFTGNGTSDGAAFGSIGYFNPDITACPSGWAPVADVAGRTIVPGYNQGGAVSNAASALASGEDRLHNHTYTVSVPLTPLSFEGAPGCCDENNAKDQPAVIAGTTNEASSNIPYAQLLTCVSQLPSFNMSVPNTALVFNAVGCPPGWAINNEVAGRFLVALPQGGLAGASFGGPSIAPPVGGKLPAPTVHSHSINGTLSLPASSTMLVAGCCTGGYAHAGDYTFDGPSDASRVDFPFTMLPLCQYVGTV